MGSHDATLDSHLLAFAVVAIIITIISLDMAPGRAACTRMIERRLDWDRCGEGERG